MKKLGYILLIIFFSCGSNDESTYQEPDDSVDDEIPTDDDPVVTNPLTDIQIMNLTQRTTFKYFWDFAGANSGAAKERYHPNDPSNSQNVITTGGSGFGLMAILVGIERNYISRTEGAERLTQILNFFEGADRFHGAWSHWLDDNSGAIIPFSSQDNGGDIVETAFFAQGLICVKEYFKNGTSEEQVLASQADTLWKSVEWDWYTNNQNKLLWHWSPSNGFAINLELSGYNETLIAFILGAASPYHAISPDVYHQGWASNSSIVSTESQYSIPLILDHAGSGTGPLFWAHYSYLGLNPTNLNDQYANYWNLNVNHTNINYQHCVSNPHNYTDYGVDCWGLTASYTRNSDGSVGYTAHEPENDNGTISPTAAISSMPYTPEKSLAAMHYFYGKDLMGPAGFYDAFNPQYNWVTERYLAIDQGPQIIMIENHRTGLLWNLFMQNDDVQNGLNILGFTY
ncbi:beta-glucosidase [Winogradskyella echinorum]|uniref:Beta-glucosidase n=1 Tax=Winogradskyella echinorum TaxID=538189 RepID=A0ABR6XXM4_9FLAO|nr:glucoamylase family protein [Winogradskyella echinorum]MBC3845236.1 beta-glucosidase [Winogradskyella echinorum]MBC5749584.1 beta-glucosidase [Winogradskyella echinorum]